MRAPDRTNKQILIVDRDVAGVEPLRQELATDGYAVRLVAGGAAALGLLSERPPDLVIVDWNVLGPAMFDLIEEIRRRGSSHGTRLMILSSLATEQDVVTGLTLGADDYIVKPFSLREVRARVGVLLRPHPRDSRQAQLRCGDLVLDSSTNRLTARGRVIALRSVEYRLLEFLMAHPGRAFNRGQLRAQVWGDDSEVDERTVDVNVQRLRKILSEPGYEACIQTVRGFGYRFAVPATATSA